jgi:hypothetical protein
LRSPRLSSLENREGSPLEITEGPEEVAFVDVAPGLTVRVVSYGYDQNMYEFLDSGERMLYLDEREALLLAMSIEKAWRIVWS